MKKQITLLFTLLFALTSSLVIAQQDVLYLIQDGTNDSDYENNGGSYPGQDRIIKMLESDANFTVSWVKISQAFEVTEMGTQAAGSNSVLSPVNFTDFELVIVSENLASSNTIFKIGNPLHPDQLTVPVIYAKGYAFRGSSSALATSSSVVVRTQELSMTVEDATSPLFNGITVSNGSSINFFRTTADDKGNVGPYSIDTVADLEISDANTLLASVPQITNAATGLGINYFPTGTQIGTTADGTFAKDAIALPFTWGAMVKKDGGNITSEFLTVWRNAAYMLTGQTPPSTLYVNPVFNDYEILTETTRYDFTDGSIIPNPSDGYVIQGSTEAANAPQTDRLKSEDGRLDYRHAPGDNYHSNTYGLDMKVGSRVNIKPLGTSVVKVPLSEYSSLDFQVKMPNNNSKSWIKVNGVATSAPSKTTYDQIIDASATTGNDLNEFITIEFFATVGNSQNLEFWADNTVGTGSDIYLPYIDVTYQVLQRKPTKVLYVNQAGVGQGAEASAPGADPIINMLIADTNFDVTYLETPADGSAINLTGYDLVIAQETISSGAALFQPGGVLGIKDVTIPIIYNKSWAFRNGKAVTDADAAVTGTQNLFVTVAPANQSNPIFSGIDFTGGNDIRIFKSATAGDDGSVGGGTKAIDVLNDLDISNPAGGSLATVPEVTDASKAFVINHIPAGTQLGEAATDVLNVDAIALSFSYGATILKDGENISPEALTIWRNAAYMLSNRRTPNTLIENEDFYIPKKVLYLNKAGLTAGAGASALGADPVISMLIADRNFDVTYHEALADGSDVPALSGFDLVIAQETFGSGDGIFKPGSALGVRDVTIPVIYNKTWAFRNGKAITDADAAVTATQNTSVTVVNPNNPLFSGIDLSGGNDIRIFASATANDDGSTGGTKGIDVLNGIDLSSAGAGTAVTVPEVTDASKAFVINYIPANTQIGEDALDVIQVNAFAFSFNYGAMVMGDGANISPEALTMWRNAAYWLTYGIPEIPTTLVENNAFTLSIDKAGEVSKVSSKVKAIGNRVYLSNVKSSTELNIYSISGALVKTLKTNEDTDFEFRSGLWIATVKTFEGEKAVKFITK
ncbi:hypothetical protein [Thalassobellus citreus]|uniref:hypothetical protein n=1 Tax=Thalassobellus citreus TaxID=3367752 RepID=UPI0037873562